MKYPLIFYTFLSACSFSSIPASQERNPSEENNHPSTENNCDEAAVREIACKAVNNSMAEKRLGDGVVFQAEILPGRLKAATYSTIIAGKRDCTVGDKNAFVLAEATTAVPGASIKFSRLEDEALDLAKIDPSLWIGGWIVEDAIGAKPGRVVYLDCLVREKPSQTVPAEPTCEDAPVSEIACQSMGADGSPVQTLKAQVLSNVRLGQLQTLGEVNSQASCLRQMGPILRDTGLQFTWNDTAQGAHCSLQKISGKSPETLAKGAQFLAEQVCQIHDVAHKHALNCVIQ